MLNPREGDSSGEIVVVWENRNSVAHPSNHVPEFIFIPSVDKGSAAMETKPLAVALKTELMLGGGRKWGGSPPKRPRSGPHHSRRSPAQREVGPAAALLQETGSRQLGWEPFVLREVCGDKQPLIIGYFIRAAATHQLLTQCLSEGPPFRNFISCVC